MPKTAQHQSVATMIYASSVLFLSLSLFRFLSESKSQCVNFISLRTICICVSC